MRERRCTRASYLRAPSAAAKRLIKQRECAEEYKLWIARKEAEARQAAPLARDPAEVRAALGPTDQEHQSEAI